jgi:multiple sugar transport system substrate-binding protein
MIHVSPLKKAALLVIVALMILPLVVSAQDEPVTLRVLGFRVPPEEIGTPLDQAYQDFIAQFQEANPNITVEALETPPDFDTQVLVDLTAGTAPDLWNADQSSLARLIETGHLLDMRQCFEVVPDLTAERFFPSVLGIHEREGGAIYGVPNGFTPMVIYYNPEAFERAGVEPPTSDWTWEEFLDVAQRLTLDAEGRNAQDPDFDRENVVQYGLRVRQFLFENIPFIWAAGGDVISPDGTTTDGYLNSPETIRAIEFLRDMVTVHGVAPEPSALDQMTQEGGFLPVFLRGDVAMFPRGHWELVGLRNQDEYEEGRLAVVGYPVDQNDVTVLYESGFVINAAVADDPAKLEAACRFVEEATDADYQIVKNVEAGLELTANQAAAEAALGDTEYPEIESLFLEEAQDGRPPYGAFYTFYPVFEQRVDLMMENILAGADVMEEVNLAVEELDREIQR